MQPTTAPQAKPKIVYIDNLKVILTVLVVLHHTFITYGAPGGWYYTQKTTQIGALVPMTMFVAVNQSFFMGFFFFLSALFVPSSYDKKGPAKFIADRLLRLGIPLLFYTFILGPVMNYLIYYFGKGHHITFLQFLSGYDDLIDPGVLWFVLALLLFTLLYALYRGVFKTGYAKLAAPSNKKIICFAVALGIASFLVRLVFPVGWVLHPVGFQFGHWAQYIALFILGTIAGRNNWMSGITYKQAKIMAIVAICLILICYPGLFVLQSIFKFPGDWFNGGFHWPALAYGLLEQVLGSCIITALTGIGRQKMNRSTPFLTTLSRSAFAVYILHPLAVISVALVLRTVQVDPAWKLLIAAPVIVSLAFLLGQFVVMIPGVNKIV